MSGPSEDALLKLVSDITDYAIFVLTPGGVVATWNRGAERMKGWSADQIVGRHFSAFYTEEDRARERPAEVLRIAAAEGRFEEEAWRVRQDGTRFWASVVITAVTGDDGEVVAFGKVTRDLTLRRDADERLRRTAADLEVSNAQLRRFRMMVTGVREYAIFMLDPLGNISTWNEGAESIKGYTAEETLGRHFSIFFTPDDVLDQVPRRALLHAATHGRFESEQWRVRKDGSHFWASVVLTAIRDDRGELVGFAKVTRDLTERHEMEAELSRIAAAAEADVRALEQFAASAAHDLQEPLRTVAGFTQLLTTRFGDLLPEQGRDWLGRMHGSLEQMQSLVDDLLEHARSGAGTAVEPVTVRPLVAEVLDAVAGSADEREATIDVDVPPAARVMAEARGLRLMLQNLVSNAVKFADAEHPAVRVTAEPSEDGWVLAVSDNGPGIPAERRREVFEPFVQLQAGLGGTGLGLAITQRIAERHGTSVVAGASGDGGGARFSLALPAAPVDA